MSDQAAFQIRDLSKVYEAREVLAIDTLDVHRGEILALVGPSGSGKSTLLRLLNFLEPPTRGWIEYAGVRFEAGKEMPLELRRRVTTVFQRPMLLDRNVWDNVTYSLRLRGQRDAQEPAIAALEKVGLSSLAQQNARLLSGGEAQRVALARAMIMRPDVLLMDEPTANLDPYNVGLIEKIIHQVNRENNTTVVLVTHNDFQARRLADRVAFLLAGKLVEVADVGAFFDSPADGRTRAFVNGEMVY
jgi:tungstate transport system ATP-binding protein